MSGRLWPIAGLALATAASALTSCNQDGEGPTGVGTDEGLAASIGDITPSCMAGCIQSDPYPDAPGYWLGSYVSPVLCSDDNPQGINDLDRDGLSEFCETRLAQAFAPQLDYARGDGGSEPYWAAEWLTTYTVRLVYALSYYRDEGSTAFVCNLPPPLHHWSCDGHNGDSELIVLDVSYEPDFRHWVVTKALFSAHGQYEVRRTFGGYCATGATYPDKACGYPLAFVSNGKHANYHTEAECESGGAFNTDTCTGVRTRRRVVASAAWNLGSRERPFLDCVESRDPSYFYYGSGRTECYWTNKGFRGWIPNTVGGATSDAYSGILSALGM